MWKELRTQHEIDSFMKEIIGFHDSCIKEIKYSSGAYVESVNVAGKHKAYINSSYSATV